MAIFPMEHKEENEQLSWDGGTPWDGSPLIINHQPHKKNLV